VTRFIVAAVVTLWLLAASGVVADAASRPTPTATATATATPAPTQTARVVVVVASPTPNPSPTPAAQVGVSSDTTCSTGLHIPLPLGQGICVDTWGVLQNVWAAAWAGLGDILATQIHNLTDAVIGPLTHTDNPTGNAGLVRVKDTLSTDAGYAFAVVFGVAVLWVTRPAWFGNIAEGIAVLWRSALVLAALASYDDLVNVWLGAVNGLSSDIGVSTMRDFGHSGVALVFAPVLLIVVGLERAVTLHLFAFVYEIGPLALVLFAWPPAADIARAWLRTFAYLSLLGPGYALMLSVIVSLQGPVGSLWSEVMLVGGLLVLALVPGIVAALLSAVSHAGAGSLQNAIASAGKIAAL